ncbi:MAG: hypothetical protein ACPGSO_00745 [Vicingaceae bacterium]
MIDIKELRIGNLVNLTKGDGCYRPYELDAYDIYKLSENNFEDIEPIPLTEEILLKCGFKELEIKPSDGIRARYKKKNTTLEISNSGYFYSSLTKFDGLHDLQNKYYYDNCKTELKIEL